MFKEEYKERLLVIIGLLLTVGLALACGGGGGGGGTGTEQGETTGTVSGTVTGSGGLSGVAISTDKGDHTTTTDSNGNYSLSGVEPNTYTLRASLNNYDTEVALDEVVTAGGTTSHNFVMSDFNDNPYVGSVRCKLCHNAYYQSWKDTLHTKKLRYPTDEPGIVADIDSDGTDDFKEALNLSTDSDFSVYGTNAPVLGYSNGNYTVKIGQVTYTVNKTIGGNWKQRYVIQQGNSHYILPIQYNANDREWVAYSASDWYDSTTNAPIYGTSDTFVSKGNQADSYERRCGGCHVTAYEPEYAAASGEWQHSYIEMPIGCETCHGQGGKHINTMSPGDIINPHTDLTVDQANQSCGMCHSRGTGEAGSGTASTYDFPFDSTLQRIFKPGDTLTDFYTYTTSDSAFWGYSAIEKAGTSLHERHGSNLVADTYIASQEHRQQLLDLYNSPHSDTYTLDGYGALTCYDCHDPHGTPRESNIVVGKDEDQDGTSFGVNITTDVDNNTLCLSCHAGRAPFAGITKQMAADISGGTVATEVSDGVQEHMGAECLMGDVPYDPEGTGVGRCTLCHMPATAKSESWGEDAEGYKLGDIHSHTFDVIWPSANRIVELDMTNSCTGCHTSSEDAFKEAWQWSISGHADLTVSHWVYCSEAYGSDRKSCVRCHSGKGFADSLTDGIGGYGDAMETAGTLNQAYKIHSCYTCHEPTASDPEARRSVPTINYPSGATQTTGGDSKICIACHQYRLAGAAAVADAQASLASGGSFSTVGSKINPHYRGGGASLYGSGVDGGYEYAGKTYSNGITSHQTTNCVGCHMADADSLEVGGHTWHMESVDGTELNNAVCATCHTGGVTSFETFRSASTGDYDGDGNSSEGIQEEIAGLKARVLTEFAGLGITRSTDYPYWSGTTWTNTAIGAAFNYNFADHDPGCGIHNGAYAIQLLRDSLEALAGAAPPGTRP